MPELDPVTILVVEDDDLDFKALSRAFRTLKVANPIVRATDGLEALDILHGTGGAEKLASPFLILLDLNMPRMGGLEFLDILRSDPHLSDTIVFVLTSSKADQDVTAAYKRHINGYITKSNPESGFEDAIRMIDHFWRVIEFPASV